MSARIEILAVFATSKISTTFRAPTLCLDLSESRDNVAAHRATHHFLKSRHSGRPRTFRRSSGLLPGTLRPLSRISLLAGLVITLLFIFSSHGLLLEMSGKVSATKGSENGIPKDYNPGPEINCKFVPALRKARLYSLTFILVDLLSARGLFRSRQRNPHHWCLDFNFF